MVHGGHRFTAATRIDEDVVTGIGALTDLAPLHQPRALAGIEAVGSALPGVPAVACFDTAFHAGLPAAAAAYALPAAGRGVSACGGSAFTGCRTPIAGGAGRRGRG